MKLKIYVLKKKQLIWAAIILAVVVVSAILIISIRATQTFNFLSLPNSFKADINNDGKIDTVVAKVDEKNMYSINVICSDENGYILEPDPVIKCFGDASSKAPINITFRDLGGDGREEIFIQSSDEHGPILHIFKYGNGKIDRIASGRYSMYGLVNNPNDENNYLVLLSNQNHKAKLTYLKASSQGLTPCVSDASLNLGANTISSVVNYIEEKDIQTVNLNIDKNMESKLLKGTLMDGIITNVEFSDSDIPEKCTYLLRTVSEGKDKAQYSNFKIQLTLNDNDSKVPSYSITDIEKIK